MVENADRLIRQNRLLTEDLNRRTDHLAAIGTVAAAVSQSLDLNRTLHTALQAVLNTVGAEAGGISLIDEAAGEVVLRAQHGWVQDFVTKPMRIPLGEGMSGHVIANDTVIVENDFDHSEPLAVPSFHNEPFRSLAMAPMHARGKIVGILSIMSRSTNKFNAETIEVLRAVADTVGIALDNARLYEASVENETQLSAVLHSTADGIIATHQNGRIRLINQTAEYLLNVESEDMLDLPLREAPLPANIRDSLLFALSSRAEESNNIFRVSLEDERILSVVVSPIYVESQVDQDSVTDGWVIVLQDVTHLHQAEKARTQFIQAAAHDMRNPLGVTLNALDMLKNASAGQDPTAREIIDIAATGVSRIQSLIDDLLNLEHLESGYGFSLQRVDVYPLVEKVSAEISPRLVEKKLTYRVDLPPDIPDLHLDEDWIARALLNYLENACKYTQHGGEITLRLFMNDSLLHVEVIDNGPGIPVEAQSRLFERFYRATDDSTVEGTGLGLAIVKSVAEAHGGGVYIRSKPGQGSTFGLTLMITSDAAAV